MIRNKILSVNIIVFILITLGIALFDFSLTLGKFHGLVFVIFMLYASALFFLVNIVLYFIFRKKENSIYYLISSLSIPSIGIGISFLAGRILDAL
jgi:hypothetical protein